MAAKDKGADVFDVLGAGAIGGGVDHAGPSLHYSNEFLVCTNANEKDLR